jgi:hypothetical protein
MKVATISGFEWIFLKQIGDKTFLFAKSIMYRGYFDAYTNSFDNSKLKSFLNESLVKKLKEDGFDCSKITNGIWPITIGQYNIYIKDKMPPAEGIWCLRSPGTTENTVLAVDSEGEIIEIEINEQCGIRPGMMVDSEYLKSYITSEIEDVDEEKITLNSNATSIEQPSCLTPQPADISVDAPEQVKDSDSIQQHSILDEKDIQQDAPEPEIINGQMSDGHDGDALQPLQADETLSDNPSDENDNNSDSMNDMETQGQKNTTEKQPNEMRKRNHRRRHKKKTARIEEAEKLTVSVDDMLFDDIQACMTESSGPEQIPHDDNGGNEKIKDQAPSDSSSPKPENADIQVSEGKSSITDKRAEAEVSGEVQENTEKIQPSQNLEQKAEPEIVVEETQEKQSEPCENTFVDAKKDAPAPLKKVITPKDGSTEPSQVVIDEKNNEPVITAIPNNSQSQQGMPGNIVSGMHDIIISNAGRNAAMMHKADTITPHKENEQKKPSMQEHGLIMPAGFIAVTQPAKPITAPPVVPNKGLRQTNNTTFKENNDKAKKGQNLILSRLGMKNQESEESQQSGNSQQPSMAAVVEYYSQNTKQNKSASTGTSAVNNKTSQQGRYSSGQHKSDNQSSDPNDSEAVQIISQLKEIVEQQQAAIIKNNKQIASLKISLIETNAESEALMEKVDSMVKIQKEGGQDTQTRIKEFESLIAAKDEEIAKLKKRFDEKNSELRMYKQFVADMTQKTDDE